MPRAGGEPRSHAIVAYWTRNSTTLLAIPHAAMLADHVSGSSSMARTILSAADANISPAQMKPNA
jgi:hypothetical protein